MRCSLLIAVLAALPIAVSGAEPAELRPLLAASIIGSDLPMAEVQRYGETRVPRMPELSTADAWQAESERLRRAVLDRVVFRGQAAAWRDAPPQRSSGSETIDGGPGYQIRKLRYEALPGFWMPALLYLPDELDRPRAGGVERQRPHVAGQAVPRPSRSAASTKPNAECCALNVEWVGMGQLSGGGYSHARMNQLDLCGTSGLAPFYLSHVACHRPVDRSGAHGSPAHRRHGPLRRRLADDRDQLRWIRASTLANPVAGYSSFRTRVYHLKDLGDSEQTPCDLATVCRLYAL
jgi:hypothetical protein